MLYLDSQLYFCGEELDDHLPLAHRLALQVHGKQRQGAVFVRGRRGRQAGLK